MTTAAKLLNPSAAIFVYVFFSWFVETLYASQQIETPWIWYGLSQIVLVWLVWWWLVDDSRKRGIGWGMDLGMFLYIAWIFVLPYHLFKTRGWSGFIPILFFILTALAGTATAVFVWSVLMTPS